MQKPQRKWVAALVALVIAGMAGAETASAGWFKKPKLPPVRRPIKWPKDPGYSGPGQNTIRTGGYDNRYGKGAWFQYQNPYGFSGHSRSGYIDSRYGTGASGSRYYGPGVGYGGNIHIDRSGRHGRVNLGAQGPFGIHRDRRTFGW